MVKYDALMICGISNELSKLEKFNFGYSVCSRVVHNLVPLYECGDIRCLDCTESDEFVQTIAILVIFLFQNLSILAWTSSFIIRVSYVYTHLLSGNGWLAKIFAICLSSKSTQPIKCYTRTSRVASLIYRVCNT